jgi:hypothetical protein
LPSSDFICTFAFRNTKKNRNMGLGSYWVRKDDHTGEAKTLKPWEESVSNGDKFFPDPNKKGCSNPASHEEEEK